MREARSAGEVNAYVYNADGLRVRSTRTQGVDSETTWILQDPSFEYAQSLEHWRSQNAGPRSVSAVFSFGDELLSQTRFDASGAPSTGLAADRRLRLHPRGNGCQRQRRRPDRLRRLRQRDRPQRQHGDRAPVPRRGL
jgi:hypothetical protein